jgi:signal transduction histidine kinase
VIIRSAFDRVFRTLVISIGIGALVFTILGVPGILAQYPSLNPVYTIIAIAVFCGLPPAMALIAFRTPVGVLRTLAIVHVAATVVFLVLWVPNMTTNPLPDRSIPWLINMITVGTCMAAISLPFASGWIYLFAIATIGGLVRYTAYGGGDTSLAFQDSVMIVLISGFMMALLQLTLRAGREQDTAARIAQEAATATAAAENLERQRTRYHAFTHDDVLATLLAASQDGATPTEVTRRSAQRTLEKMDQFRDDVPVAQSLTMAEFEANLRHAASLVGVPIVTTLTAQGGADLDVPTEVADALTEALTEAMRNSVRHGDWPDSRDVHREARADRTDDGVELSVTDNGRGFNPRRIGLDRLGVRLSILQRVNSQHGAEATITSARGSGTTVRLCWTAGARE